LLFDTNYWKSWLTERLAEPIGSPTAMDLFGSKSAGTDHQLLADHLTAEYGVTVTAKARTVEEWHLRPEATDNHWLDCLAMSAALAALLGASLNKQDKPTAGGSPKDAPPARPAYQRPRQRTAKPL
jgi:phage terminase large subunit GpA-like protein